MRLFYWTEAEEHRWEQALFLPDGTSFPFQHIVDGEWPWIIGSGLGNE